MKTKGALSAKYRSGTFVKDCPTIRGIINNIGAKKMKTPAEIEAMIEHYHNWFYDSISSETHPIMAVPNFGNFYVSPVKTRMKIIWTIKGMRAGSISYERGCEIIRRYYPMYKRAHWESLKRGRGIVRRDGKIRKSLGKILQSKMRKTWK